MAVWWYRFHFIGWLNIKQVCENNQQSFEVKQTDYKVSKYQHGWLLLHCFLVNFSRNKAGSHFKLGSYQMWNFISLLKGIFKPALYHYNVSSIWKKDIVMMQSWLKTLAKYPFKGLTELDQHFFLPLTEIIQFSMRRHILISGYLYVFTILITFCLLWEK